jgi:lysophospholipase L1-like esterase
LGIGINEIANRGIGGDITEGFYKRLETIYPLKPEMCFIMGGINDIGRGIPVENILENMEKITEALEWNGIKPIIQSTLYVSKARENWEKVNRKVDAVNKGLKEIGIKRGIPLVDINGIVSAKGALKDEYTYDGVHLDGAGYKAWGKEIGNIIKNE